MRYLGYREIAFPENADFAEKKRLQSEGGYALLKELYRAYFGKEPPAVCFAPSGKPYFEGEGEPHFSLSHDGAAVACVLDTECAVGLDVAHVRMDTVTQGKYRHILSRVYSEEERQYVWGGQTNEEKALRFYTLWAKKEAATKKTGAGIFGMPPLAKTPPSIENAWVLPYKMQSGVYIFAIV